MNSPNTTPKTRRRTPLRGRRGKGKALQADTEDEHLVGQSSEGINRFPTGILRLPGHDTDIQMTPRKNKHVRFASSCYGEPPVFNPQSLSSKAIVEALLPGRSHHKSGSHDDIGLHGLPKSTYHMLESGSYILRYDLDPTLPMAMAFTTEQVQDRFGDEVWEDVVALDEKYEQDQEQKQWEQLESDASLYP